MDTRDDHETMRCDSDKTGTSGSQFDLISLIVLWFHSTLRVILLFLESLLPSMILVFPTELYWGMQLF